MPAATPLDVTHPKDPSTLGGSQAGRRIAVLWGVVLAVYWITLFVGTHTPADDLPGSFWDYDKLLHAGAYFGLTTLLLVTARRFGSRMSRWTYTKALALGLAYGAFDEITQHFVGRQCEFADWLADGVGVLAAIGIDLWRHK